MYMHNLTITETERKTLKNAWLRYFNDQLFEEGLITDDKNAKQPRPCFLEKPYPCFKRAWMVYSRSQEKLLAQPS